MNRKWQMLLGLPKSIYFNLRCFDLKTAMKLPVLLGPGVKIGKLYKNVVKLHHFDEKRYRIAFGIGGSEHVPTNDRAFISFGPKARIIFNGTAIFGEGTRLRCDHGVLEFGKNFSATKNCCFNCEYHIKIGDDALFGWDVYVRDTDGHDVFEGDEMKLSQKEVVLGNHVWVCSFSHILKGVTIGNDTVIAWRSTVLKPFPESNLLIGGSPAKVIKQGIDWKK